MQKFKSFCFAGLCSISHNLIYFVVRRRKYHDGYTIKECITEKGELVNIKNSPFGLCQNININGFDSIRLGIPKANSDKICRIF